jgi:3-dehydroquinate dehydratase II
VSDELVKFLRGEAPARWTIGVIDGPNMPNLGARDPQIYGPIGSLAELQKLVSDFARLLQLDVTQFASNHEGEILEFIHAAASNVDGFLINPAGLTTYGEATRHALQDSGRPYVEVHFANTMRHYAGVAPAGHLQQSRFTFTALGLVMGMRQYSYLAALLALACALDDDAFLAG